MFPSKPKQWFVLFKPYQKGRVDVSDKEDQDNDWEWYSSRGFSKLEHYVEKRGGGLATNLNFL